MNTDRSSSPSNNASTSDGSERVKRRKLNPNFSFKNEMLKILQKISNESYETDGAVEHDSTDKRKLLSVVNNWNMDCKLVYGLRHLYSESDLSFENLKQADKAVADVLLNIANSTELKVFLTTFQKTSRFRYGSFNQNGDEFDITHFEPDGGACVMSHSFTLKSLISTDGKQLLTSSLKNVDLDEEVIPENCFDGIEPYSETIKPSGHTCLEICKLFRCAAIAMWPMRHFFQILKKSGASSMDMELLFLNEAEKQENTEETKKILLVWAEEILSNRHTKSVRMIKTIVGLDNIALIKDLFSRCVILNESSIPILNDVCDTYGWNTFSTEISTMFKRLSKEVGAKLLSQLVLGTGQLQTEKQIIFHKVLVIILDKCRDEPQSLRPWYSRISQSKATEQREQEEILLSICRLALVIKFNMLAFARTKSLMVFVPVLLRLVPNGETKLDVHWLDVCQYYLEMMENEIVRSLRVSNWKRDDTTSCPCRDCLKLNIFLESDLESIRMKVGKGRRRHLHEEMNSIQNIVHKTDHGGLSAVLVITKTSKTGSDEEEKQEFAKIFLEHLRSITPM